MNNCNIIVNNVTPARSDRERHTRARPSIICDTADLSDVTFIARNGFNGAMIFNAIYPDISLAIMSTNELNFNISCAV